MPVSWFHLFPCLCLYFQHSLRHVLFFVLAKTFPGMEASSFGYFSIFICHNFCQKKPIHLFCFPSFTVVESGIDSFLSMPRIKIGYWNKFFQIGNLGVDSGFSINTRISSHVSYFFNFPQYSLGALSLFLYFCFYYL
jgi:hypothetical protein